ncbi:thioesterase family protein [Geodermatophilus sp. YIM 151500]|uniref:acyl-CoA thioesterase domain-containing protein n=1 Tax=Geodermatophilus sp. YIM 151500 TaxID=2984531 RepID=UPI0021E3E9DD|nr:acyl-CoA thioesterase domain-containing protein [Geodermatophilus sp. YIM 151500]MCV2490634.1 thioesterase family protein [Geodermatophilus sp. YIM 151500]
MGSGAAPTDRPDGGIGGDPDVEAAALRAVARTRALGMHFYGHVLGITARRPPGAPPHPWLEPDAAVTPGPVPPVSVAAIADLAMGSAVRAEVGAGRRLGTVTMALHHLAPDVRAPVTPAASVVSLDADRRHALARCELTDASGAVVAAAQGWFMALPVPGGARLPLLPWERDEPPDPPVPAWDALRPDERAAVEATLRAGARARARGTSVSAELTAPTWEAGTAEGTARGRLRIGPALTNRVGHVQGGALYGIGLAAAARAVGPAAGPPDGSREPADGPRPDPADGYWQFLRPGDGDELVAEASVTRRGRSAAFAAVTVTVDGVPVGTGSFAFRPPSAPG